jgi:AcrR family transcriptional regulator
VCSQEELVGVMLGYSRERTVLYRIIVRRSSIPVVEDQKASSERRRVGAGGRRLDASRDAAILRAALEGLAEHGYDRLTMDDIAARAHAGKGALYRRWSSKAALVADAVVAWREALGPVTVPDTGSLRGDFEAGIASLPDFDTVARGQFAVIMGLVTAASRDPELQATLSDAILERPRRALREALQRAVVRGEISPDRNLDLVPDVVIGLNTIQMMVGKFPDRVFIRRVFEEILYPLVTAPVEPRPERRQQARSDS